VRACRQSRDVGVVVVDVTSEGYMRTCRAIEERATRYADAARALVASFSPVVGGGGEAKVGPEQELDER